MLKTFEQSLLQNLMNQEVPKVSPNVQQRSTVPAKVLSAAEKAGLRAWSSGFSGFAGFYGAALLKKARIEI